MKEDNLVYLNQQMNYCIEMSNIIHMLILNNKMYYSNQLYQYIRTIKNNADEFYTDINTELNQQDLKECTILLKQELYISNELYQSLSLITNQYINHIPDYLPLLSKTLNECILYISHQLSILNKHTLINNTILKQCLKYKKCMYYFYQQAIYDLLNQKYDYKTILNYHLLYDHFIKCIDLCLYMADSIENICSRRNKVISYENA